MKKFPLCFWNYATFEQIGEDPVKCGLRELSEETGFSASGLVSLGYIYPTPGYDTEKIHIFIAKNLFFYVFGKIKIVFNKLFYKFAVAFNNI